MELNSLSFNIHTWPSFLVVIVFAWKTYLSFFRKKSLYAKGGWLGPALFIAWAHTWVSAAVSYYVRTLPSNPQHPAPSFLLPYQWMGLQIALPFLLGGVIGFVIVRKAAASMERPKLSAA
jgi:hypothetical protein